MAALRSLVAFRFPSLRARLATFYAGLFAVAMVALFAAMYVTTERSAARTASGQLASSGAVYDRLWTERAGQLRQAAGLLAMDFGFRAAVATGDHATALSAIGNLKGRLGLRTAFLLDGSGQAIASGGGPDAGETERLWRAFDDGRLVGIATIAGTPRQIVAAPVRAPGPVGWIVFAVDLDQRQMTALEQLSPVPIVAGLVAKSGGQWRRLAGRISAIDPDDGAMIDTAFDRGGVVDAGWHDGAFATIRPLPAVSPGEQAALVLLYPQAAALAAFRPIQAALAVLALVGTALVVFASWQAAARITRPLALLDHAARLLAEGERQTVEVDGDDELARLSHRFNAMAGQIEERERRIRDLAFNDTLTGLPNREMFHEHAELLLERVSMNNQPLALLCLDLDNFKAVNDTLGHAAGDALLVAVGERLRGVAGRHFVARLGSDEFAVFAALDPSELEAKAGRILAAVSAPVTLGGQLLHPGTSIGIAVAGPDGKDIDTLLRHAHLALHRAKEAGRGGFCFFEQSLNERAQARRRLEADLRRAIARSEFALHFQPLFDLGTGRIGACEALIRWHHPERGLIAPVEFIPVAEQTGMIVEIGAWAMREACRIAASWPGEIRIAVNVSAIQFQRPGLTETVIQALAQSGLPPHRLEIEITESVCLESGEATLAILHRLHELGVRIALDDFGTGYSSLSYLQSFPFDKIKIDRSFIQELAERPGAIAVVRAITELAAALGMETTAEGVEDSVQLEQLKAQGCTSVQGFLFSKPLDAGSIERMIGDISGKRDAA